MGRVLSDRSDRESGNWFCFPEYIERQMDLLFARPRTVRFLQGVEGDAFLIEAAAFLSELNAIHPFRESNGRAQRAFLYLVALTSGQALRLDRIEPETFMPAMAKSFDGGLEALHEELSGLIGRPE